MNEREGNGELTTRVLCRLTPDRTNWCAGHEQVFRMTDGFERRRKFK